MRNNKKTARRGLLPRAGLLALLRPLRLLPGAGMAALLLGPLLAAILLMLKGRRGAAAPSSVSRT